MKLNFKSDNDDTFMRAEQKGFKCTVFPLLASVSWNKKKEFKMSSQIFALCLLKLWWGQGWWWWLWSGSTWIWRRTRRKLKKDQKVHRVIQNWWDDHQIIKVMVIMWPIMTMTMIRLMMDIGKGFKTHLLGFPFVIWNLLKDNQSTILPGWSPIQGQGTNGK